VTIETELAPPLDPPAARPQPVPAATARPERPQQRLYVLDLLRFLAAMAVLFYHYLPSSAGAWHGDDAAFGATFKDILQYAWLGVEAFFVISGFVICMSSWGRSLSQFFISRVTRLMPAYMVAVVLTTAVVWLIPLGKERFHLSYMLIDLTMVNRFLNIPAAESAYWTLFTELKFYLLFAIVVAFGVTYRRVVLFCLLWTVATLFTHYTGSTFLAAFIEPFYASFFVMGITLYLIHRFGPDLLLWCMLGTSFAISMACLAQRDPVKRGITSYPIVVLVMFVFVAVMVVVALGGFNWIKWRGLVTVGALTYPVYLLHHKIGLTFVERFHDSVSPWLLLAAVVVGVLLLSYAVHRLAERPLARVLKRGLTDSFARIRTAGGTPTR